jgi:arylsulfatase A-like enzyme
MRKSLLLLGLSLVGLGGCSRDRAAAPPAPPPPHVLLIVVDCLRADHVGAYGHPLPTTPNIDRLAAEGIRFESAYANATWTKPSMATLFTGLHPSEHGLLRVGEPASDEIETDALPEDIPTLAESFRAAGYRTIAVVNQIHLKPEFGFARGFESYRWVKNRSAYEINRELFEELGAQREGRPVFAWLHYIDVHWPYKRGRKDAPPELGIARMHPEPPLEQSREVIEAWVAEHMNEANRRALETRYDREVAFADGAVGDLVERVRAAGALDDTWIVVTSDHGEGFLEHGRLMHGFRPYEEVARVPLVMRPPPRLGLPRGVRSSLVSHADFAPTLTDLLGLRPLPDTTGRSYADVLRGRESPARTVLLQSELASALRSGRHKLIVRQDEPLELYDLGADPAERRNLATERCEGECVALRGELERRTRALGPQRVAGRGRFTPEEAAELRALGYL